MKKRISVVRLSNIFLCTVFFLIPSIGQTDVIKQELSMYVGELKVLRNMNVDRIAIGNGSVIKVRTLPKQQLLFMAESAGSSTVYLWHKSGKETSINLSVTPVRPSERIIRQKTIYMDVKIVEFRKNSLDDLGIEWQQTINGPAYGIAGDRGNGQFRSIGPNAPGFAAALPTTQPFSTYFGIISEITSRINLLVSNGDAYLLAQPKLSCRSGGQAKFLAGGEIALPTTSSLGQSSVQFKEYGIILEIAPVADDTGLIAAKIMTEVSTIDASTTVNGIPGFLTRRTETEINVKENETIVISGLLNHQSSTDIKRVPFLSKIPILGALFRSKRFQNQETELVIFVTPRIIDANSPLNKGEILRAQNRLRKEKKGLEKRLDINIVD